MLIKIDAYVYFNDNDDSNGNSTSNSNSNSNSKVDAWLPPRFGLPEDDVAALEWYRRASDQGDQAGSFKVGEFYEHGYGGLEQSEDKAKEYYAKGGDNGASAVWRLEEPERNRAELQRLTDAADGGGADAQAELGRVYEYGTLGTTADPDRAESLYAAAAGGGSAQGKYYLGLFLIKVRARKHLQEAADLGQSDASYCLSKLSWYF
jgi:TPR repeat protein